jgi:hypothetical protein
VVGSHVIVGGDEEPAGAAGRVADHLPGSRGHHVDDGLDEGTRREILPRARLDVLGVLFQEPLVDGGLDVDAQADPGLAVNQIDQPAQLGRVLDAVLRLAEDDGDEARPLAQLGQDGEVVALQVGALSRAGWTRRTLAG